jgi:hypothetical protein
VNASKNAVLVLGSGGDTLNTSAAAAVTVTGAAGADIVNHASTGALTFNSSAGGDTIIATSTGAVTVNQLASTGVTTVNLNATNAVVDTINLASSASGSAGVVASVDRVVINGFDAAQDRIVLDIDQTSAGTSGGAATVGQVVSAAGTILFDAAASDVLILNFDLGGSADVIGTDLTGANLLANIGTLATASVSQKGYVIAYDAGNAYLYALTNDSSGAGVLAAELTLISVINDVAIGTVTATDFILG